MSSFFFLFLKSCLTNSGQSHSDLVSLLSKKSRLSWVFTLITDVALIDPRTPTNINKLKITLTLYFGHLWVPYYIHLQIFVFHWWSKKTIEKKTKKTKSIKKTHISSKQNKTYLALCLCRTANKADLRLELTAKTNALLDLPHIQKLRESTWSQREELRSGWECCH